MKAVQILLAACIILLLLPAILVSVDSFRVSDYTEMHNVTTAAGVTTANITLTQDLYDDDTVNISSISSNITNDSLSATSYTSSGNRLLVSGFVANTSHQVTIDYGVDALADYWGAETAAKVIPVMIILGIFGLVGGAIYLGTRRSE